MTVLIIVLIVVAVWLLMCTLTAVFFAGVIAGAKRQAALENDDSASGWVDWN